MNQILFQAWNTGGVADSKYSGIKNSFARMIGWDVHSKPGLLQVNQAMAKLSGTTITELCKEKVDCSNGIKYWFSSTSGKIWQDKAGVVTLVYTVVPNAGSANILGAQEYAGYLYFFTQSRGHRIPIDNSKADGASAWTTNAVPNWAELNLDQATIGGTGATAYSLTNAINEGATHKQTFIPVNNSLEGIRVKVVATGTSVDWTVAIHDTSNTLIGSATVIAANIATGLIYFTFSSPLALTPGATYHIHLYASATTGTPTADTSTNNDWEAGQVSLFTISDSGYHPTKEVNLVLYIGDRNFVHQIDSSTNITVFSLAALDLPAGYRITALGKFNTDLLVGTMIASTVSRSEIFRWNTYGQSFINSDTVYEPGINCFLEADNYTIVSAGLTGNLYSYNGINLVFYKRIPGTYSTTQKCIVYPNATALLNGFLPIFGVSNYLGNPTDEGIWSLAKTSNNYPTIMNLEFPISQVDSSGYNLLSGIIIGAVLVSGQDVYMSWQKDATITVTIANPGVVTSSAHGLADGDAVVFATTSVLPTGIIAGTTYFAKAIDANSYNLYDTAAHAVSGGGTGRVTTSGSQSGVHTASNFGVDKLDYSNKIAKPILETRVIVPQLGVFTTFNKFHVTYESLNGTSMLIKYSKNGASYATDLTFINDTDRNELLVDGGRLDARTLQMRYEAVSSGNNAPQIQEIVIDVE